MTGRLITAVLASMVLVAICLTAPFPSAAGDVAVNKDQPKIQPTWPAACRMARKYCRIVRTCREEQVSDCSQPGGCKLLYRAKRVCHCNLMCRWPGRPSCMISAECPPEV
jgi:hypothetical protein